MSEINEFEKKQQDSISYFETGSGPVLLLLHGLPESGTLWRKVAPALSAHFRVLVPDLPGSGESPLPEEPLSIDLMAEKIHAFLQALEVDSYVLAGHSMGGYVALALAENHPEGILGVALVHSTAAADTAEKIEQRQKAIALIRKGAKDEYLKASTEKLFAPGYHKVYPDRFEEQLRRSEKMPAESLISYNEALADRPDRTGLLHQATLPYQWILGDADQVISLDEVLPLVALPSLSFLSLYKGVGHMGMIEAPERVVADLTRFGRFCIVR